MRLYQPLSFFSLLLLGVALTCAAQAGNGDAGARSQNLSPSAVATAPILSTYQHSDPTKDGLQHYDGGLGEDTNNGFAIGNILGGLVGSGTVQVGIHATDGTRIMTGFAAPLTGEFAFTKDDTAAGISQLHGNIAADGSAVASFKMNNTPHTVTYNAATASVSVTGSFNTAAMGAGKKNSSYRSMAAEAISKVQGIDSGIAQAAVSITKMEDAPLSSISNLSSSLAKAGVRTASITLDGKPATITITNQSATVTSAKVSGTFNLASRSFRGVAMGTPVSVAVKGSTVSYSVGYDGKTVSGAYTKSGGISAKITDSKTGKTLGGFAGQLNANNHLSIKGQFQGAQVDVKDANLNNTNNIGVQAAATYQGINANISAHVDPAAKTASGSGDVGGVPVGFSGQMRGTTVAGKANATVGDVRVDVPNMNVDTKALTGSATIKALGDKAIAASQKTKTGYSFAGAVQALPAAQQPAASQQSATIAQTLEHLIAEAMQGGTVQGSYTDKTGSLQGTVAKAGQQIATLGGTASNPTISGNYKDADNSIRAAAIGDIAGKSLEFGAAGKAEGHAVAARGQAHFDAKNKSGSIDVHGTVDGQAGSLHGKGGLTGGAAGFAADVMGTPVQGYAATHRGTQDVETAFSGAGLMADTTTNTSTGQTAGTITQDGNRIGRISGTAGDVAVDINTNGIQVSATVEPQSLTGVEVAGTVEYGGFSGFTDASYDAKQQKGQVAFSGQGTIPNVSGPMSSLVNSLVGETLGNLASQAVGTNYQGVPYAIQGTAQMDGQQGHIVAQGTALNHSFQTTLTVTQQGDVVRAQGDATLDGAPVHVAVNYSKKTGHSVATIDSDQGMLASFVDGQKSYQSDTAIAELAAATFAKNVAQNTVSGLAYMTKPENIKSAWNEFTQGLSFAGENAKSALASAAHEVAQAVISSPDAAYNSKAGHTIAGARNLAEQKAMEDAQLAANSGFGTDNQVTALNTSHKMPENLAHLIERAAAENDNDINFAKNLATQETGPFGYSSTITSPVGARGVVQMTADTARRYGLVVNQKVDQRTDPAKEVPAAMKFVHYLKGLFNNDPAKVAAAYNCGDGCVRHKVSQYQADWQQHLPAETKGYVKNVVIPTVTPAQAAKSAIANGNEAALQAGAYKNMTADIKATKTEGDQQAAAFTAMEGIINDNQNPADQQSADPADQTPQSNASGTNDMARQIQIAMLTPQPAAALYAPAPAVQQPTAQQPIARQPVVQQPAAQQPTLAPTPQQPTLTPASVQSKPAPQNTIIDQSTPVKPTIASPQPASTSAISKPAQQTASNQPTTQPTTVQQPAQQTQQQKTQPAQQTTVQQPAQQPQQQTTQPAQPATVQQPAQQAQQQTTQPVQPTTVQQPAQQAQQQTTQPAQQTTVQQPAQQAQQQTTQPAQQTTVQQPAQQAQQQTTQQAQQKPASDTPIEDPEITAIAKQLGIIQPQTTNATGSGNGHAVSSNNTPSNAPSNPANDNANNAPSQANSGSVSIGGGAVSLGAADNHSPSNNPNVSPSVSIGGGAVTLAGNSNPAAPATPDMTGVNARTTPVTSKPLGGNVDDLPGLKAVDPTKQATTVTPIETVTAEDAAAAGATFGALDGPHSFTSPVPTTALTQSLSLTGYITNAFNNLTDPDIASLDAPSKVAERAEPSFNSPSETNTEEKGTLNKSANQLNGVDETATQDKAPKLGPATEAATAESPTNGTVAGIIGNIAGKALGIVGKALGIGAEYSNPVTAAVGMLASSTTSTAADSAPTVNATSYAMSSQSLTNVAGETFSVSADSLPNSVAFSNTPVSQQASLGLPAVSPIGAISDPEQAAYAKAALTTAIANSVPVGPSPYGFDAPVTQPTTVTIAPTHVIAAADPNTDPNDPKSMTAVNMGDATSHPTPVTTTAINGSLASGGFINGSAPTMSANGFNTPTNLSGVGNFSNAPSSVSVAGGLADAGVNNTAGTGAGPASALSNGLASASVNGFAGVGLGYGGLDAGPAGIAGGVTVSSPTGPVAAPSINSIGALSGADPATTASAGASTGYGNLGGVSVTGIAAANTNISTAYNSAVASQAAAAASSPAYSMGVNSLSAFGTGVTPSADTTSVAANTFGSLAANTNASVAAANMNSSIAATEAAIGAMATNSAAPSGYSISGTPQNAVTSLAAFGAAPALSTAPSQVASGDLTGATVQTGTITSTPLSSTVDPLSSPPAASISPTAYAGTVTETGAPTPSDTATPAATAAQPTAPASLTTAALDGAVNAAGAIAGAASAVNSAMETASDKANAALNATANAIASALSTPAAALNATGVVTSAYGDTNPTGAVMAGNVTTVAAQAVSSADAPKNAIAGSTADAISSALAPGAVTNPAAQTQSFSQQTGLPGTDNDGPPASTQIGKGVDVSTAAAAQNYTAATQTNLGVASVDMQAVKQGDLPSSVTFGDITNAAPPGDPNAPLGAVTMQDDTAAYTRSVTDAPTPDAAPDTSPASGVPASAVAFGAGITALNGAEIDNTNPSPSMLGTLASWGGYVGASLGLTSDAADPSVTGSELGGNLGGSYADAGGSVTGSYNNATGAVSVASNGLTNSNVNGFAGLGMTGGTGDYSGLGNATGGAAGGSSRADMSTDNSAGSAPDAGSLGGELGGGVSASADRGASVGASTDQSSSAGYGGPATNSPSGYSGAGYSSTNSASPATSTSPGSIGYSGSPTSGFSTSVSGYSSTPASSEPAGSISGGLSATGFGSIGVGSSPSSEPGSSSSSSPSSSAGGDGGDGGDGGN